MPKLKGKDRIKIGPPRFPFPRHIGPAPTVLAGSIAGGVGCDYQTAQRRLLFVEFGGQLSAFDTAYAVLGTGYAQPEDVRASVDGVSAYVTERTGNLLRVDLGNADRSNAVVVATGMTAPHQMVLNETAGVAYVVEFAASGTLWRVDLVSGSRTALVTGLDRAVGLAMSADNQLAYVSEQTSGPEGGRISQYRIADGLRTTIASGLVAPFMLTWTDPSRTRLFCPERDPENAVVVVDVAARTTSVLSNQLDFRPSCVALADPTRLLVTCDQVVDELRLGAGTLQPTGPLLEGIGFVPFDWITPAGLADTTSHDPAYFFGVHDAPFGGSLPVMVNFTRAELDGAAFYRVTVDGPGGVRTDEFPTAKWNGVAYDPVTITTQTVGGLAGFYAVPPSADLPLFVQPLPGCYLDSTNLASGTVHTIEVEFFDAAGTSLESATPLTIFVDNRPCAVTLDQARIGSTPATTACGFLPYHAATAATDRLTIDYTATQPGNFGDWGFSLTKASMVVASVSGPLSAPPAPFDEPVAVALGGCTVAAYAVVVSATAGATTGWGRCSQYDASAVAAFALAP